MKYICIAAAMPLFHVGGFLTHPATTAALQSRLHHVQAIRMSESFPLIRLRRLVKDRVNLLTQLAPTLTRVNPTNPRRSAIEHRRTIQRKALKKELAVIDAQIVAVAVEFIRQKSHDPTYRRTKQQEYRTKKRAQRHASQELSSWEE
jgi:hypothetical protein